MSNPPILHIEDEDASAFMLQAALDEAKIRNRTFRVSSGENGLAFLCKSDCYHAAQSPGLVLLDLHMPRVDGWAVLAAMQRKPELSNIPVVVLSANQQETDKERAFSLGAREYVIKQNSISALSRALLDACSPFVHRDTPGAYTLKAPCIAYHHSLDDNGAPIKNFTVLAEHAQLQLLKIDSAAQSVLVRHDSRDLCISPDDFQSRCISNAALFA